MADVRSLATLEVKIDGLRDDIKELCTMVGKQLDDHEARIRVNEKG